MLVGAVPVGLVRVDVYVDVSERLWRIVSSETKSAASFVLSSLVSLAVEASESEASSTPAVLVAPDVASPSSSAVS